MKRALIFASLGCILACICVCCANDNTGASKELTEAQIIDLLKQSESFKSSKNDSMLIDLLEPYAEKNGSKEVAYPNEKSRSSIGITLAHAYIRKKDYKKAVPLLENAVINMEKNANASDGINFLPNELYSARVKAISKGEQLEIFCTLNRKNRIKCIESENMRYLAIKELVDALGVNLEPIDDSKWSIKFANKTAILATSDIDRSDAVIMARLEHDMLLVPASEIINALGGQEEWHNNARWLVIRIY